MFYRIFGKGVYVEIRIYVGNLPFKTTNEDLAELFQQYGTVKEANIIRYRKSGRSKGYAFVIMDQDTSGNTVESLHKQEYKGRILKVKEAKERLNFPSSNPEEEIQEESVEA
ncbi:MAG: RNA recognition motif-containing protein [bacterium]|jgi:RNA recognition motif-containing protein